MTSQIDFTTLPINVPALCIPRVFTNIKENRILDIFEEVGLGEIDKIVIAPNRGGKGAQTNHVFVYFKSWKKTETATEARRLLLSGDEIKIIYDEPWFWKVSAMRNMESHNTPATVRREENEEYKTVSRSETRSRSHHTNEYSRYNRRRNYKNLTQENEI